MAKSRNIENGSETPQAITSIVSVRKPESKLNLTTVTGKKVGWTLEEALKPHNFKQLSEKMQKAITQGKSASQILAEMPE